MRFDGVEFGLSRMWCRARFEAGDDFGALGMTPAIGFLLDAVSERDPEIGLPRANSEIGNITIQGETKIRARHTDDGIRFTIQLDFAAQYIRACVELRNPEFVADDSDEFMTGLIVARVKCAAEHWSDAERVEEFGAYASGSYRSDVVALD